MKTVYLLFSGEGENSWKRIKENCDYYLPLRSEPDVALVDRGDVLMVLVKGEDNLRQRVDALVGELREHVIPSPFTFGVFVHHEDRVEKEEEWDCVWFGYHKDIYVLLPAVTNLLTSFDFTKDFQGLVEHLQEMMKNKRYGTRT